MRKMIVVESGGSKSTWVFGEYTNPSNCKSVTSVGLHPREISQEKHQEIAALIKKYELLGSDVYFFGAGCESQEAKEKIKLFLEENQLNVKQVETDIFAACLVHLGDKKAGVVGILGTGAIAAQYDGNKVVRLTSGLGYILGDEGSGFDIGKRLLKSYFKQELSETLKSRIEEYFEHKSILHRIHAEDGRKVIAGLTKLVYEFKNETIVQTILDHAFSEYCKVALQPLNIKSPVHFVGSIASVFENELRKSLNKAGLQLGNIEKEAAHKVFCFLSDKKTY